MRVVTLKYMAIVCLCVLFAVVGNARGHIFNSFDGDSNSDLIISTSTGGNGQIDWYEYNPSTGGTSSHTLYSYVAQTFDVMAIGDIDKDEHQDLLVGGSYGIKWYEARLNDTATSVSTWGASGWNVKDIKIFNNTAYIARPGYLYKLTSSSAGSATLTALLDTSTKTYNMVCPSDFDLDGKTEVFVAWYWTSDPTSGYIDLYEDDGTNFTKINTFMSTVGGYESIAGLFDDDGYMDLFISCTNSNGIMWFEATGADNAVTQRDTITTRSAKHLMLTDLDGDGNKDLIISAMNNGESTNWVEATGDNSYAWRNDFNAYHRSGCLAAGDYDNDGLMNLWFGSKPSTYDVQWGEASGADNGFTGAGSFTGQYNAAYAVFSGNPNAFYAENWNLAAVPRSIDEGSGLQDFVLNSSTKIYYQNSGDVNFATVLKDYIKDSFGLDLTTTQTEPSGNSISLGRDTNLTHTGGYQLTIGPSSKIIVKGKDQDGVRSGVGTVMRILGDARLRMQGSSLIVPAVAIDDYPAITGMRGLDLQMNGNIQDVNSVKHIVQAGFKTHLNTLVFDIGKNWDSNSSTEDDGTGYTKAQIRDMVQYAKKRGFTVIPASNLLGHYDRSPYWKSTIQPDPNYMLGINMKDANNYELIDDLLDEIRYDFGNPAYFHAGMDETFPTLTGNAVLLGKSVKDTFADHITAVDNLVKNHGMSLIICHDMLVYPGEVSGVAHGTSGATGSAAARFVIPDDVIIDVWEYNHGSGGLDSTNLFQAAGNPVINSGWMLMSIADCARTAVNEGTMGAINTQWVVAEMGKDVITTGTMWTGEHFLRVPTMTAHYTWYKEPDEDLNTAFADRMLFDSALATVLDRWARDSRQKPSVTAIDLSGLSSGRHTGDDAVDLLEKMMFEVPRYGIDTFYLMGEPFKLGTGEYVEIQSPFDGTFPTEDRQDSASYYHHVHISRAGTIIADFNVSTINEWVDEDVAIYTRPEKFHTLCGPWATELVVENEEVTAISEYAETGDSRVPKNGFVLMADNSARGLLEGAHIGDKVEVTRVPNSGSAVAAYDIDNRNVNYDDITIAINSTASKLTFLHATPYATGLGQQIGTYRITYSDATYVDIPVVFGKNIGSMSTATSIYDSNQEGKAWLAYSNYGSSDKANDLRAVYAYEWTNPYPAKTISSVKTMVYYAPFTKHICIAASASETFDEMAVGDLDGDSYMDLIVCGSGGVKWYESRSADSVTLVDDWSGSSYNDVQFGDHGAYIAKNGAVELLRATADNTAAIGTLDSSSSHIYRTACPSDFDADGIEELLVGWTYTTDPCGGHTDLYEVNSSNHTLEYSYTLWDRSGIQFACGYLDNDSYMDVIVGRYQSSTGGYTQWLEATGSDDALVYRRTIHPAVPDDNDRAPHRAQIIDIDEDGYNDLLLSSHNGKWWAGKSTVRRADIYEANGDNQQPILRATPSGWRQCGMFTAGDYDDDGLVDIFMAPNWDGSGGPASISRLYAPGNGSHTVIDTGAFTSDKHVYDGHYVSSFDGDGTGNVIYLENPNHSLTPGDANENSIEWYKCDFAAPRTGWSVLGINKE
ncbi:MAG: hypothetical protein A2Y12_09005 [Planctomycetes bacterium GWF2_42_9]|nr:MAG: hypothetical protein A2Y12_09005 [Planctomycetes bacterium GWF2_42_9]